MFVFLCRGLFLFLSPSARFHLWSGALALPVADGKMVSRMVQLGPAFSPIHATAFRVQPVTRLTVNGSATGWESANRAYTFADSTYPAARNQQKRFVFLRFGRADTVTTGPRFGNPPPASISSTS
jgi:hypothetical protein